MSRLVDYFAVVGYDHEKDRRGLSNGVVIQRFPEVNWEDTPFHDGLEWFCQPQGWTLSTERQEPRFFVSVLTDIDANRHYCACLCFNETASITPLKTHDEEEEMGRLTNITHHSIMYAPKCLVILSRQDYIETFKNCLGIIYTVWVESIEVPLETLVGNLVGCILVPPPGGPQVRFSIGAGDRQALQPPNTPPLPVTHSDVYTLFNLLGIHNSIALWCAVMTEQKVLLVSTASSRLSAACRALAALMYPFRYAHVYIPILPASLLEVLSTPTPFLIGIHSTLKEDIDLLDVIMADLDSGCLTYSPGAAVVNCDGVKAGFESVSSSIGRVLQPGLRRADAAFAPPPPSPPPQILDKQIRAVFMRTLATLLQGYRSFLTIIRIHPNPVLTFHKEGFLGGRGLTECNFAIKLMDCMFFNGFVSERGAPWRPADLWDDLYQNLPEQLRLEAIDPERETVHIQELAQQILLNENPNPQTYQQIILRPPDGASNRIHIPPFPLLDPRKVREVIADGLARNALNPKLTALRTPQPRIIPLGAPPTLPDDGTFALNNSARRLEVLQWTVNCIISGRYADARKSFPAALRALRAAPARLHLPRYLAASLTGNKCLLDRPQFESVVRLMNCALASATAADEHSVAAALLPLATAYCRKLCTGVIQYAYMCLQEHSVWSSQQFWEAAFYLDVQKEIKSLYLPSPQHRGRQMSTREDPDLQNLLKSQEPSALEIAAEQMRLWPTFDAEKRLSLCANEESTLYAQAVHYANRMVNLLVPLESASYRRDDHDESDRISNSITNSVAESDSADAESGFEEADPGESGANVIKMVSRFVDKVCTEGQVSAEHVRRLHQMVPGVVHMQLELLDAVARELKRLPPVPKPRILPPSMLVNESLAIPSVRAFLLPDGRECPLLPAEGELFLTDYRLIFKGVPTDPIANEQIVIRSFPICSLTREKTIRINFIPQLDQTLQDGLQLRSATFQLIKVGVEAECSEESWESFRKCLTKLRQSAPPHASKAPPQQDKHHTLRGFAKKTLMMTARRAGIKTKTMKRQKYVLTTPGNRALTSPPMMSSISADTLSLEELEIASADAEVTVGAGGVVVAAGVSPPGGVVRTLERLTERSYARDWTRLGLATSPYRLSPANALYTVAHSYPALIPVPCAISDESLRRIARCYRQSRLPVPTWRHPVNHAVIVRSASCHHKGVMGMLKATSHQTQQTNDTTNSIEQERYLNSIVSSTPGHMRDSTLSLDSLVLNEDTSATHTPLLTKHLGTLGVFPRTSGGKGGASGGGVGGGASRTFARWGSLNKERRVEHLEPYNFNQMRNNHVESDADRRRVYVLCEKGAESTGRCEYVSVEYPDTRATRSSFKKLLRATAPSAPPTKDDPGYYKLIEDSGWLQQLRQLFQLSGAVVDLIDLQGSSVILSLEDGWDATAQISSLAQICLDPYYRRMEGFRVLIEKEWLALGHKFQQRLNLGPQPQQGFTPTFLQFLDAVHQLQKQFPMAFEFNDLYLRMLAYHSVSCRFRTFLLDSEAVRVEMGIAAVDDKRGSLTHRQRGVETCAEDEYSSVLFDYLDRINQRAPVFYNWYYSPDIDDPVLRPQSSIAWLEIWDYYVSEELGTGTAYDIDMSHLSDIVTLQDGDAPARKVVTAGYDCIYRSMPDAFSGLLESVRQMEQDLGHLPTKWRLRWEQLELPNTDDLARRQTSFSSELVRRATRSSHKRATLEVLTVGRSCVAPHQSPATVPQHRLTPHAAPALCIHCGRSMYHPLKGMRCAECGLTAHEKCAEYLPYTCPARTEQTTTPNQNQNPQQTSQQYYEQYSTSVAENRTHEGHLYKRGALLKGWKQRWFVLDSIKHQLRYYDAMEDSHCKGYIDLAEVIAVTQAAPTPGPPKKTDDRSFFDLRTSRRTYNFCASDANAAQEWIEKLQACLQ